jgi:hypothetical protein
VDPKWVLDKQAMLIPAGSPATTYDFTVNPWNWAKTNSSELDLLGTLYHMHNRGSAGKVSLVQGKKFTTLNEDKNFNYAYQYMHYYPAPVTLVRGRDKLNTECTWNNTQANQPVVHGAQIPTHDITWGEGTLDEMCMWVHLYGERGSAGLQPSFSLMDLFIKGFE